MYKLKAIVERYGHTVFVINESRVGYVAYEDAIQVVAEPFAETRTR